MPGSGQTTGDRASEQHHTELAYSEYAVDWKNDKTKLRRGIEKANEFRRELLRGDAITIGTALQTFRTNLKGPRKGPDLERFRVTPQRFVTQLQGAESLNAADSFAPFAGRWYGEWNKKLVDHHWSDVFVPQALESQLRQQSLAPKLAAQFAWIGDGFGWNLLVQPLVPGHGPPGHTILGYVYHVKAYEPQEVLSEFPLVGYADGPGRVIWVTPQACYFEEIHPDPDSRYSITGFHFELKGGVLTTDGLAFQAVYTRDPKHRPQWLTFDAPSLGNEAHP